MSSKRYTLNDDTDWDSFYRAFLIKITAERIAHLALLSDPSQFNELRIKKPLEPQYLDYKARVQKGPDNAPRFVRGEQPAIRFSELVPEDQEDLKAEITLYRTKVQEFNKQADGISNVLNWVLENVDPHYFITCIPEQPDNIPLFFTNLKAACGINDELRRKRARQRYFEVLNQARAASPTGQIGSLSGNVL